MIRPLHQREQLVFTQDLQKLIYSFQSDRQIDGATLEAAISLACAGAWQHQMVIDVKQFLTVLDQLVLHRRHGGRTIDVVEDDSGLHRIN